MLNSRVRYGLLALLELSLAPPGKPLLIHEIAEARSIPEKYLQQILATLKASNYVKSRKGPGGGFVLARLPESVNLLELASTLDSNWDHLKCDHAESEERCGCLQPSVCPIRCSFTSASHAMEKVLVDITLGDLRDKEIENLKENHSNYVI